MHKMIANWWLAIRPKTLPASLGPVILGTAVAATSTSINVAIFITAMVCALCLQIAVNLANDWFDSRSGVDSDARLGPVRVSQSGLISPTQMKIAMALVTLLATVSGLILVVYGGWPLLLCGVAALLAVYCYSGGPYPLASHGLGELAVLVFFGWLGVTGSAYLHTGEWSLQALGYGTVAGLFAAAIMLVNNIRDIPTDTPAGKHTLAVKLGDRVARKLYQAGLLAALLLHLWLSWPHTVLTWLPLLLCIGPVLILNHRIKTLSGAALNQLLAQTAQLGLLYCLVTAVAMLLQTT